MGNSGSVANEEEEGFLKASVVPMDVNLSSSGPTSGYISYLSRTLENSLAPPPTT